MWKIEKQPGDAANSTSEPSPPWECHVSLTILYMSSNVPRDLYIGTTAIRSCGVVVTAIAFQTPWETWVQSVVGPRSTEGLKIIEEKVLPLHWHLFKLLDFRVFYDNGVKSYVHRIPCQLGNIACWEIRYEWETQ